MSITPIRTSQSSPTGRSGPTLETSEVIPEQSSPLVADARARVATATTGKVVGAGVAGVVGVSAALALAGILVRGLGNDSVWELGRSVVLAAGLGLLLLLTGAAIVALQWKPMINWVRARAELSRVRTCERVLAEMTRSKVSLEIESTHSRGWDVRVGSTRVRIIRAESIPEQPEAGSGARRQERYGMVKTVYVRGQGPRIRTEGEHWVCTEKGLAEAILRSCCRWWPGAL